MAEGNAARNGALILAANTLTMLAGGLYWFILARIVGLGELGVAASLVSAASIPAAVLGGGFGLALARGAAAGEYSCVEESVVLVSLTAGAAAGLLGYSLQGLWGFAWGALLGSLVAAGLGGAQVLIARRRHAALAIAQSAGNLAKLAAGIGLGTVGYGAVAVMAGYVAQQLPVVVTALYGQGGFSKITCGAREAWSALRLGVPDSLYQASGQVASSLGVYLFALLGGSSRETSVLYVGLVAAGVVSMPTASLVDAVLPYAVTNSPGVMRRATEAGLVLSTLLGSLIGASAGALLAAIGATPILRWVLSLRILALAGVSGAAVAAAIVELNRLGSARGVALVAGSRLAVLLVAYIALAPLAGILGAAAAYLLAALLAALVGALLTRWLLRPATGALLATLVALALSALMPSPAGLLSAAAALLLSHFLVEPLPRLLNAGLTALRGQVS